eukprot:3376690-Alexandrium_andersonii.AAC.1
MPAVIHVGVHLSRFGTGAARRHASFALCVPACRTRCVSAHPHRLHAVHMYTFDSRWVAVARAKDRHIARKGLHRVAPICTKLCQAGVLHRIFGPAARYWSFAHRSLS